MATHSSILAWEIPWTEEPGRLQPMELQRVGTNLMIKQQQTELIVTSFSLIGMVLPGLPGEGLEPSENVVGLLGNCQAFLLYWSNIYSFV